jgi:hypothetical protein
MFCPRQLFRAVNRCRPPRWLSTVQHDSANILHDPQSIPATHTVQHDSSNVLHDPQSKSMQHPTHVGIAMQLLEAVRRKQSSACFKIALKMKTIGMTPDISIYNGLMSAIAAKNGHALLAWAILDDMLLEGIQPTVTTFFHLIHVIMTPFHFQVSPLIGISRRNVKLPVDICGAHWRQ